MKDRDDTPKPMTDEEWEENKNCDIKKRDHKWYWKNDIATGMPHPSAAVCAHCGIERELNREDMQRGVTP
jgi:hypothetical protein